MSFTTFRPYLATKIHFRCRLRHFGRTWLQKYTFSLKQQIIEADFLKFWVVICLKIYPRKLRKLQIAQISHQPECMKNFTSKPAFSASGRSLLGLCRVSDWGVSEQPNIDYQAFSFYKNGAFIRVSKSEILTKLLFACNLTKQRSVDILLASAK